jgi:hypothetical protein
MNALMRYAAVFAAVLGALGVVAAAGCTSHATEFESLVPPPPVVVPVDAARASLEAARLLDANSGRVIAMSPDALAPFALAAADDYRASAAPYVRRLALLYANTLLMGAVPLAPGATAYISRDSPERPSARVTALAGEALVATHAATGKAKYLQGAREAARAVVQLRPEGADAAAAYLFFATSGNALGLGATSRRTLLSAVRVAARALPERVDGAGLDDRAWVLLALASSPSARDEAAAARGASRIWKTVFHTDGTPSSPGTDDRGGVGIALSVSLFQAVASRWGTKAAGSVLAQAYRSAAADGTITLAPGSSVVAQAYYALAFARRLASLRAAS